jgi:hypothetical protein
MILTESPNAWKAACEQNGGTFSISNLHVDGNPFNPLTPPAYAYVCDPVSETFWNTVLTSICFAYPDVEVAEWTHHDGTGTGNCIRKGTT